MGVADSVTFSLVNATPYSVQYLMEATGQPGATVLRNNQGLTPDLATDALTAAGQGGSLPLSEILATVCADAAQCEFLLLGDNTAGLPAIANVKHCHVEVVERVIPTGLDANKKWQVTAVLDPAAPMAGGRAALSITPPDGGTAKAYLYLRMDRTINS